MNAQKCEQNNGQCTSHKQSARVPKGRFAPSPSGRMHLGNVFSCLIAWLAARSAGAEMVLRIEDLDERSSKAELAEFLMDDLLWLGLDWDEGPYWQSKRMPLYKKAVEQLEELGLIYPCFCTRAELHVAQAPHTSDGTFVYSGTCRSLSPQEIEQRTLIKQPALRLAVPNTHEAYGLIDFNDCVFGHQHECLARNCGDFLIRRSDGVFAYQLAVVVDDANMGVTQIVRGRDLLSSTARQIYIQRLLGFEEPKYAHIPLLVAPDFRRLSKRDRDLDMDALRKRFSSPEPIVGRLAQAAGLIETAEPISAAELIPLFSWEVLRKKHKDIVVDEHFLDGV